MTTVDMAALAVTVLVCGIAPLAVALALGRRLRLPKRMVAIAAGCYLLNLALQQPIFAGLRLVVGGLNPVLVAAVLPSMVYGITEEIVRYLSWRAGRSMRHNRTSNGAIVAGLAWGGVESLMFTLMILIGVLGAVLAPVPLRGMPQAALAAASLTSLAVFAAGRLCALAAHLAFAHLSVQAYRRSVAYLPLVIAAHIIFDASVFALAVVLGPHSRWPMVLFGALAAAALVAVVRLRRGWTSDDSNSNIDTQVPGTSRIVTPS